MIRGHLDALTPGGFAEGWAYDTAAPDAILTVCIAAPDGAEIARGYANLHRGDLAEVGFRHGWCAFRLRLSRPTEALAGARLVLREAAGGAEIHATDAWRIRDTPEPDGTTVERIVAQDPTMLRSVQQLTGCAELMARHAAKHGVAEFVRTAYAYVLGRAADAAGQALYERMLRAGAVTPLGVVLLLAESAEFKEQPRLLASPATPGFVFAT
ncbi:DUF4214 domain-containing protein [Falsiroseomonas oryzae]|uniref:DUF4214 domain-containing protein n=1 Tax=Falsiroseomonas oryzae TaxID=2766473 RepID=UPI0022EA6A13|nr:DUF4214 domain-containing protein [Roseomonas sp. MO-31]